MTKQKQSKEWQTVKWKASNPVLAPTSQLLNFRPIQLHCLVAIIGQKHQLLNFRPKDKYQSSGNEWTDHLESPIAQKHPLDTFSFSTAKNTNAGCCFPTRLEQKICSRIMQEINNTTSSLTSAKQNINSWRLLYCTPKLSMYLSQYLSCYAFRRHYYQINLALLRWTRSCWNFEFVTTKATCIGEIQTINCSSTGQTNFHI